MGKAKDEFRSYSFRRGKGASNRDLIFRVIDEARVALTSDRVSTEIFGEAIVSRQSLNDILGRLSKDGSVMDKSYKVTYSRKPRIDSIIATIYYTKKDQRRRYEREVLPELERETRSKMEGRSFFRR
ncbi:MAG: hypothetical protein ACE5KH_02900 [Candidatus Geothermarchaeales archaeon]